MASNSPTDGTDRKSTGHKKLAKQFMLDELAWKSMTAMLNLVWEKLADLQEESAIRMAQNGEPGVATVVGLAGFEAPKGNPEAKPRKRK